MSSLNPLLVAWDEAHREFAIALNGVPDEDLWKRPHPRLLSIGELAGHVAYWQASWLLGGGDDRPDLSTLPIQSPFLNHAFRYYTPSLDTPVALPMNTEEVAREVISIHQICRTVAAERESDSSYGGQWGTWGNLVQYQVFHVAYHAGQVYSVRHLLGHETEDN
ncbi:MAG TPA: DinB family protein [Fimbriimonadaceae bacterium]|nr:DinB family protein [Fimbriimonadaceae bacterium]